MDTALAGDSAIEQAALEWVVALEAQHGRVGVDHSVDPTSLSGKTKAGMMAVFAELERGMKAAHP